MKPIRAVASALCLLFLAGAASAQTGEPVDRASLSPETRMNMAVANYAFDYQGSYKDLVTPSDILRLAMVAKFNVIALTCEGFEVDDARYNAVLKDLVGPRMAPAPGDETGGAGSASSRIRSSTSLVAPTLWCHAGRLAQVSLLSTSSGSAVIGR